MDILTKAFALFTQAIALHASMEVIYHYRKSILTFKWITPAALMTSMIVWHFIFNELDSSYWFTAWGLDYMRHPFSDYLISHGIVANIPFRHIGVIVVAVGHIYAYDWISGTNAAMKGYFKRALFVSAASIIAIVYLAP